VSITSARLFVQLGITQTIGYAASYFLPAVLADAWAANLINTFDFVFSFVALATI
jgi:hypothetical protein